MVMQFVSSLMATTATIGDVAREYAAVVRYWATLVGVASGIILASMLLFVLVQPVLRATLSSNTFGTVTGTWLILTALVVWLYGRSRRP